MKPRIPHPLRGPACNLCDVIKYGYFHQLRLVICSGIHAECRDANRRTPIILCAFMEPEAWGVGTARTLIENGVRLDRKDRFGRNVLHYACIHERFGLLHVLLKAIDFDLNQSDKLGNTALHYAAMSGNVALTQVISRAFQRYKISPDKPNRRGLTAIGEALRLGNTACARVIEYGKESDNNNDNKNNNNDCSNDNTSIIPNRELHFDQLLPSRSSAHGPKQRCPTVGVQSNGGTTHHLTVANNNNPRLPLRPLSAVTFLTRRDSTSSSPSLDGRRSSLSYRSRSNTSRKGSHRMHQSPLLAMGIRKEDDVIYSADEKDFRNTPDFVFKLLHLHFDMNEWNPLQNLDSTNRNTAWTDAGSTNQSQTVPLSSRPDWRQDLKSLFKVYESQCSSSWRVAPKAPPVPADETDRPENEDEERGKKSRRHSNHARPAVDKKEQAGPDLRRRPSTTRIRRLSSVHGPIGKMAAAGPSLDGHLDTSTESINSLVSANKKRVAPPERENSMTGRLENAPGRSGVRRPSLEPSCPSSACSSPTPSSYGANDMIRPFKRSDGKPTEARGKNNNKDINSTAVATSVRKELSSWLGNAPAHEAMNNERRTSTRRRVGHDEQTQESSKANSKLKPPNTDNAPAVGIQITVPTVEENLIGDERSCNNGTSQLDTNRLWVQNPYDDLSEDDDEDEGDFNE